jgi:hypothetical protein
MRTLLVLLTLCAFAPPAIAQLDSNSVTVFASRSASLQADQVVFAIAVDTGVDATLNDVVAALQNAGITLSNFASVRTLSVLIPTPPTQLPPLLSPPPQVEWTFGLPAPISKLADTAALLRTVQQSIVSMNKAWIMSFGVQGTQVSLPLQQSQVCSVADLIADARLQAQKLAGAAGMTLGNVLALSGSTSMPQLGGGVYLGSSLASFLVSSPYLPPQTCSATVKFALK